MDLAEQDGLWEEVRRLRGKGEREQGGRGARERRPRRLFGLEIPESNANPPTPKKAAKIETPEVGGNAGGGGHLKRHAEGGESRGPARLEGAEVADQIERQQVCYRRRRGAGNDRGRWPPVAHRDQQDPRHGPLQTPHHDRRHDRSDQPAMVVAAAHRARDERVAPCAPSDDRASLAPQNSAAQTDRRPQE